MHDSPCKWQFCEWSAVFGYTITNLSTRINSAGAVEPLKFDQLAGHSWKGSTLAPAAFVRCVWHYQRQEMHVNNNPRLLAAGEIAVRSTHVDLVPMNMSKLVGFLRTDESSEPDTLTANTPS